MQGTTVALVSWPANSEFSIILRALLNCTFVETALAVYTPTVTANRDCNPKIQPTL